MPRSVDTTCPPRISLRFAVPCRRPGCAGCTHAAEDDGTRCGDAIGFRLRIDDAGRIERACFEGEACSVALDMAERLADHCEGRNVAELRALGTEDGLRLYGEPIPSEAIPGALALSGVDQDGRSLPKYDGPKPLAPSLQLKALLRHNYSAIPSLVPDANAVDDRAGFGRGLQVLGGGVLNEGGRQVAGDVDVLEGNIADRAQTITEARVGVPHRWAVADLDEVVRSLILQANVAEANALDPATVARLDVKPAT
jgi:NifU-like protein involved in Fe-S cluster formation